MEKKTFKIPMHDTVNMVAFCPYEHSGNLLAICTPSRISIYTCTFAEEAEDQEKEFVYSVLKEFHQSHVIFTISWSPKTMLRQLPKCLQFAVAGNDKTIWIFTSDLANDTNIQTLTEHDSFVNQVAFHPTEANRLASVSDDLSCCLWDTSSGQLLYRLALSSPGTAVCWHHAEPGKLVVGEKRGVLRMFITESQQPVMVLSCHPKQPLLSADWSLQDPLVMGCVAGLDWFIWNASSPSRPQHNNFGHSKGATVLRLCPTNQHLVATRGRPATEVKVFSTKHFKVVLSTTIPPGDLGGLSWHYKLPVLAAGGDRTVFLWRVDDF